MKSVKKQKGEFGLFLVLALALSAFAMLDMSQPTQGWVNCNLPENQEACTKE